MGKGEQREGKGIDQTPPGFLLIQKMIFVFFLMSITISRSILSLTHSDISHSC